MQLNFDDARAKLIENIDTLIKVLENQKEYLKNVTHDELKERYGGEVICIDTFHSHVEFVVKEINSQYKVFLSWVDATEEQMKAANKVKEIFNILRDYDKAICPNDVNFIKLLSKIIKRV